MDGWNYDDIAAWEKLCDLCASGSRQSPIDLSDATESPLAPLEFDYYNGVQGMFHTGTTVQVQCANNSSLHYDGETYRLVQFHFHHPSEHRTGSTPMAMELHLVHQNAESGVAVVAVMIQAGDADNPHYAPVFDNLTPELSDRPTLFDFDPAALLPADRSHFYTYNGSLTTPPCTENVRWFILDAPVTVSQRQIDIFAACFAPNARPLQSRNGRPVRHR